MTRQERVTDTLMWTLLENELFLDTVCEDCPCARRCPEDFYSVDCPRHNDVESAEKFIEQAVALFVR